MPGTTDKQAETNKSLAPLVFLWDNFGPMHVDRCKALSRFHQGAVSIFGVQMNRKSHEYSWQPAAGEEFELVSLFPSNAHSNFGRRLAALWRLTRRIGRGHYFFSMYERPEVFLIACWLRISGSRVFVMNDSKFDDKPRYMAGELVKFVFYLPYNGAITGSRRAVEYLRFLGMAKRPSAPSYDTLSIERIRSAAGVAPAPEGTPYRERVLTSVARLLPGKNHLMLFKAYQRYRQLCAEPRRLQLCGDGPFEAQLRRAAEALEIAPFVDFRGFLQSDDIAKVLGTSLVLVLPSVQETFGMVVTEAQALGLPVIVSETCGARDELVRNGVNGYVVETDNAEGLARFLLQLSENEPEWRRMALSAIDYAPRGDVSLFVKSAEDLIAACKPIIRRRLRAI